MVAPAIYNLNVELATTSRAPKVGLLEGRTGIPVFVLYLKGLAEKRVFELYSARDVEAQFHGLENPFNIDAWASLIPFFDAGGKRAHVVTLPLPDDESLWLTTMIGRDRGLSKRDGIYSLKEFYETADLAIFPQASLILDGKSHGIFYNALLDFLEIDPHFFAVVDFPASFQREEALNWLKGRISINAAAFYPWLIQGEKSVAPAAVVAAAIQLSDEKFGINHLPSNQTISGKFRPLFTLTPGQITENLNARLNSFQEFDLEEIRIWGGYTLADKLDPANRFISTRRTLLAIQEAIVKVCEPFVLEPLYSGLEKMVDVSIQSAFQPMRKVFDPEAKNPFQTQIEIAKENGQDVIQVKVGCFIPYALDEMRFSLGLAG